MAAQRGARHGLLWVRNDEQFFSLDSYTDELGKATDIIPVITNSTIQAPDGSVWVASTLGLHRVGDQPWQSPEGFRFTPSVVHAAYQIAKDTTWFAASKHLLRNQNGDWTRYALPDGHSTYALHIQGLAPVADGQLAVNPTDPKFLLLFDLRAESFSLIEHPESGSSALLPHAQAAPHGSAQVTKTIV